MTKKKYKVKSLEKASKQKNTVDDLEQFVQNKKNQNSALNKILAKLNTDENYLNNE